MKRALEILGEANKPNKIVARDTVVFSKLMDLLDHPHRSFKSVHVTGTNGKGSVTLKMATILEKAGYRVGMYTSPHLFSFLERIQINRANISQDYFASRIEMLNKLANTHALPLTFFEVLMHRFSTLLRLLSSTSVMRNASSLQ